MSRQRIHTLRIWKADTDAPHNVKMLWSEVNSDGRKVMSYTEPKGWVDLNFDKEDVEGYCQHFAQTWNLEEVPRDAVEIVQTAVNRLISR